MLIGGILPYATENTGVAGGCPRQVASAGDKPAVVALYTKAAARAFEPFGKARGEVSYETSLSQVRSMMQVLAHHTVQVKFPKRQGPEKRLSVGRILSSIELTAPVFGKYVAGRQLETIFILVGPVFFNSRVKMINRAPSPAQNTSHTSGQ